MAHSPAPDFEPVDSCEAAHRPPDPIPPHVYAFKRKGRTRRLATSFGGAVRIGFGAIWLIDASLKWLPSFQNGLLGVISDGAQGAPSWLMPWFRFNLTVVSLQPRLFAIGIALVETILGLCLILGLARKPTYIVGAVWSLLVWSTAEGFGNPGPGMPWTDIGTAVMYTFIFLALLALDAERGRAEAGTRRYSLDAAVERRLPRWRRIAELRPRPTHRSRSA